ncbi:hypothetical protein TNCV_486151 [Trichonephila clavipes]|nr:hypothetical protein TNCV_486151 [Trichonephila clavipes]
MPQWRKNTYFSTILPSGMAAGEDVLAKQRTGKYSPERVVQARWSHQHIFRLRDGSPPCYINREVDRTMYCWLTLHSPDLNPQEFLLLGPSEIVCVGYTRVYYDRVKIVAASNDIAEITTY